jgi:hypothetical protein
MVSSPADFKQSIMVFSSTFQFCSNPEDHFLISLMPVGPLQKLRIRSGKESAAIVKYSRP